MIEKSRLLSAGQTRNRSKSPVHHILLAVTLVLLCCIAVPQNVHASRPTAYFDMGKKTTYTVGLTWYRTGTVIYRNECTLNSTVLAEARDTFFKDYQKEHPGSTFTESFDAYNKALDKLTLKNTKPSILKASLAQQTIFIDLKKAGKATVTIKGKLGNTKINIKINITSYAYDRPFTSVKVNGKSYKDAFKVFRDYQIHNWDLSIKSLKVQFKLKKGWSLKKVAHTDPSTPYWDMVKKTSTVMNFKLATPKTTYSGYPTCRFILYNKKNKQTIEYDIQMLYN